MSRKKAIQDGKRRLLDLSNQDEYEPTLENVLGRTYSAGFIEGSGQSSITGLEREVIAAALEWLGSESPMHADNKLIEVTQELKAALEKAETE